MLGFCPNKKFKSDKNQSQSDWEILVEKVGENQAMKYFMENNDSLPSIEFINSLESKQSQFSKKYDQEMINTKYNETEKKYHTKLPNEEDHIVKNRVSDDVAKEDKKRNFPERTDKEKRNDEVKRKSGNRIHNILENIGRRFVQKLNGEPQEPINEYKLGSALYKKLEEHFNNVISQFKPGTIFKIEQIVYNPKTDKAGRIDVLAIEPDGTHSILDWKLIDFFNKDGVPYYKEENFNIQLNSYKQILREAYGAEKFRLVRVQPIAGTYTYDRTTNSLYLKSIDIGGKDFKLNPDILNPLPAIGLKGTEPELTGNEQIDNLINKLINNLKRLSDKTETTISGRNLKKERIEAITKTIKELQLKQDIELFLEHGKKELDYIVNKGLKKLTDEELNYYKKFVDFYTKLLSNNLIDDVNKKKYFKEIKDLTGSAGDIFAEINSEILNRVMLTAQEQGQNNAFDAYPESGLLGRLFKSASQSNHPLIRTLYQIVMKQKDKVLKDINILKDEITLKEKNLKEWAKNNGLSGLDIFKPLLQFNENGKWTGDLIYQYSKEYRDLKKKAEENKDYKWLQENIKFNKDKYNQNLKKNIESWKELIKLNPKSKSLADRIEQFEKQNNVEKYPQAYLTVKYWYIHPIEKWRSNEYKYIYQPGNEPLKEFYELFTRITREYEQFLDKDIHGNFVPNVSKALIEQIMNNGLFSISGMKQNLIDSLSIKSDVNVGMIDDNGQIIRKIPIFYTNKINPNIKSYDLAKSLLLFADMALTNKYMSEIEDSALLLEDAMTQHPVLLTDATGNPIKNKITGKAAEILNSKSDINLFTDYLNFYVYGIKQNSKDKNIGSLKDENDEEVHISGLKTFGKILQFYSAKALSLNLASSVANGLGGNANAFIEGSKGRFYNSGQYLNSIKMLTGRNNKAILALEYFDIFSDNTSFKKAQALSASNTLKHFTFEKFYLLQHAGDYSVESCVLLAMLQSHTIDKGKIIKIKDKETQKSLLELSTIDKDKFSIEGLSDEEFGKFRRKVKYLYSTMKGNNNHDDISQIKLSILGQVLMQFRNWIPRMAEERFGDMRYTADLELYELGRYRNMWDHLINKNILPNILSMIGSNGIFGLGKGLLGSGSLQEAARKQYLLTKAKNPELQISEEEYIELYIQNIRSTMMELQMILAVLGLFALVKPGDNDDKKDPYKKTFVKLVGRSIQELTFFLNPDSTQSITRSFIPILGMFQDIIHLLTTSIKWGFGEITFDENIKNLRKEEVRQISKQFPLLNGAEHIYTVAIGK